MREAKPSECSAQFIDVDGESQKVQTKSSVFSVDADDVRHSRALGNCVFCVVSLRGLDAFVPDEVASSAVGNSTY